MVTMRYKCFFIRESAARCLCIVCQREPSASVSPWLREFGAKERKNRFQWAYDNLLTRDSILVDNVLYKGQARAKKEALFHRLMMWSLDRGAGPSFPFGKRWGENAKMMQTSRGGEEERRRFLFWKIVHTFGGRQNYDVWKPISFFRGMVPGQ